MKILEKLRKQVEILLMIVWNYNKALKGSDSLTRHKKVKKVTESSFLAWVNQLIKRLHVKRMPKDTENFKELKWTGFFQHFQGHYLVKVHNYFHLCLKLKMLQMHLAFVFFIPVQGRLVSGRTHQLVCTNWLGKWKETIQPELHHKHGFSKTVTAQYFSFCQCILQKNKPFFLITVE